MLRSTRFGHVSVPVRDLGTVTSFYRELLGLSVTMEGSIPALGDFVFLAGRSDDELPLIALHTRAEAKHAALEVESLDALKAFHADVKAKRIPVSMALNHGCSLSLYFHDPEGNMLEVFWATGERTERPVAEPFNVDDLDRPDAEIRELIAVPS